MTDTPRWLRRYQWSAAVLNVMLCGFCLGSALWIPAILCGAIAAALILQILDYP